MLIPNFFSASPIFDQNETEVAKSVAEQFLDKLEGIQALLDREIF